MNTTYQLGLLHIVYALINVDGMIDEREMETLTTIQHEEKIPEVLFKEFSRSLVSVKQSDVYYRGVELLKQCTEDEKLCAFVHLFKLAEADTSINFNEVRLLLNAVKLTNVDFDDIAIIARLNKNSTSHAA